MRCGRCRRGARWPPDVLPASPIAQGDDGGGGDPVPLGDLVEAGAGGEVGEGGEGARFGQLAHLAGAADGMQTPSEGVADVVGAVAVEEMGRFDAEFGVAAVPGAVRPTAVGEKERVAVGQDLLAAPSRLMEVAITVAILGAKPDEAVAPPLTPSVEDLRR